MHRYTIVILGLSLFIVFDCMHLNGQQMKVKNMWTVNFAEQDLNYGKMSNEFAQSPEANIWYNKSLKSYKNAKTLGWVTLGSLGAAWAMIEIKGSNASPRTVTPVIIVGIGLLVIVAPITGVASIVSIANGASRQKKAVDAYNQYSLGLKKEEMNQELVLGVTQNGLGFVYRF